MALILFHTRPVREALSKPAAWGTELFFLLLVGAVAGALVTMARQVSAPYHAHFQIDLSFAALPKYTLLSMSRGLTAYILSLLFTLVYGTLAAHNPRAEKLMLPALDVLQAIPVLGFLPGLVLAMVSLFPTREIGLELACIIMINRLTVIFALLLVSAGEALACPGWAYERMLLTNWLPKLIVHAVKPVWITRCWNRARATRTSSWPPCR